MRVLVAGGTGEIGRRVVDLLIQSGHSVSGITRSDAGARSLAEAGAVSIRADAFDADALQQAMVRARPEVVINQLTDLSGGFDPDRIVDTLTRNARIRTTGTKHLVAGALEAGARRIISQSIAWGYAPGAQPHLESDPLNAPAEGLPAVTMQAVATLETLTLATPGIDGVVLRYGMLRGTSMGAIIPGAPTVHVDAAAAATVLAMDMRARGVYNIVDPGGPASGARAEGELGWRSDFRMKGAAPSDVAPSGSADRGSSEIEGRK